METYNIDQVNKFILFKQHLSENSKINDIVQISEDLIGLQSTGPTEPYLNLLVRTRNFKKQDLDTQLYDKRSLGKIRGMRKSMFILPTPLIPVVHNAVMHLTAKRVEKYLEMRKITIEEYRTLSERILELLDEREMHTSELKKEIDSDKGLVAVISVMNDEMKIIRSRPVKSWKDRRMNYARFSNNYPEIDINSLDEDTALLNLIRKYIKNYGPVTEIDITWWTGVTKGKTRQALKKLEDEIISIRISELEYKHLIHESDENRIEKISSNVGTTINLLPRLDPYLMGYKDRERYMNVKDKQFIFDVSGNAVSVILLNGRVIGVWDITDKPEVQGKIYLFRKLDQKDIDIIFSELKIIGQFLTDKEPVVKICDEMTPLSERTMGSFMTPLKDC